jgi:hypothetical protein
MNPFKVIKTEKGYILPVNTLGIAKEDLSIKLVKPKGKNANYYQLSISGETEIPKVELKSSINLQILVKINEKIKGLSFECKNGITLIYLEAEMPEDDEEVLTGSPVDDFDF